MFLSKYSDQWQGFHPKITLPFSLEDALPNPQFGSCEQKFHFCLRSLDLVQLAQQLSSLFGENNQNQCLLWPGNNFISRFALEHHGVCSGKFCCAAVKPSCCSRVSPPWCRFQPCTRAKIEMGTWHHCNEQLSWTLKTAAKKMDLNETTGMRPGAMGASPQIPHVGHGTARRSGSHSFKPPPKPELLCGSHCPDTKRTRSFAWEGFTKTEKLFFPYWRHTISVSEALWDTLRVQIWHPLSFHSPHQLLTITHLLPTPTSNHHFKRIAQSTCFFFSFCSKTFCRFFFCFLLRGFFCCCTTHGTFFFLAFFAGRTRALLWSIPFSVAPSEGKALIIHPCQVDYFQHTA